MRHLFHAILVPALLFPVVARAQLASPSDADRMTARALAHDGYEAQTHGRYAEAADHFRRAEALVHAPTLELGLARADVGLGKLVEAHEIYRRIAREELAPGSPPPFARAVASAKHELAALEARLAWVSIAVQGPSSATVTVSIDEAPFPIAALGTKRASDPGEHHVRASAPGFAVAESTFVLEEGQSAAVTLTPTPLPEPVAATHPAAALPPPTVTPAPVAVSQPPAPVTEAPRASTPVAKTVGAVTLGLGLAGLGAGGILGVLALNKHAALIGDCPGGHCPAGQSDQVSQYNALAMASTVCIIAGAAGVVGGLTLVLTAPRSPTVTAYAGFSGAGITGGF